MDTPAADSAGVADESRTDPGLGASPADLGVPVASSATDGPARYFDYVGNHGDRAYFIASSPGPGGTRWWLTAVEVSTGVKLFNAVALNTGEHRPECFINGPAVVLCVNEEASGSLAWVIDIPTGRVSYFGPTDLTNVSYRLRVIQAGKYAIAQTPDKGIYGIGPRAQTTWFIPGEGSVPFLPRRSELGDVGALPLAIQRGPGRGADNDVVFRVSDGTVITPSLPEGTKPGSAAVFPGGFAVEVISANGDGGVRFFDNEGKLGGRTDVKGTLTPGPVVVPTMESARGEGSQSDVLAFAPDGGILARMPGVSARSELLFGSQLWLGPGTQSSQRYDLTTGQRLLPNCQAPTTAHVANDGITGVFATGTQEIGMTVFGMNLDTCEVWWTQTSPAGTSRDLWRINTTLVQESDDGTELMSLVAPS